MNDVFLWSFDQYQRLAMRTCPDLGKPADHKQPVAAMTAVLGLCGESGEVAELYKKFHEQHRDFTRQQLISELGDCLWYLARIASVEGIELSEIAEANIAKLQARYPNGFVPGGGIRE